MMHCIFHVGGGVGGDVVGTNCKRSNLVPLLNKSKFLHIYAHVTLCTYTWRRHVGGGGGVGGGEIAPYFFFLLVSSAVGHGHDKYPYPIMIFFIFFFLKVPPPPPPPPAQRLFQGWRKIFRFAPQ